MDLCRCWSGVEKWGRGQGVTSVHSNPWAYLNALRAQCARQTRLQGRACGSWLLCADRYHFFTFPWSVDINKHSPGFHHLCGAFRRQNAARFNRRGKLFQLVGILIPMSSSDALLLLLVFSLIDAARGSITVSRVALRCAQWVGAARASVWGHWRSGHFSARFVWI